MIATKSVAGFGLTIALVLVLTFASTARAQEPDVQITALQCSSDPEIVLIKNLGDDLQELAGWQLQSDPVDSEVFDLDVLGGLPPGAVIYVRSGPSASGIFAWGPEFVFRDDDPTDYARIVDDTGAVVHQVNCGPQVAPQPSPTPSPQPSPTPRPEPSPTPGPEPSPAADVPNGGGPPPPPGGALAGAMMILLGGSMAAAGAVTVGLSWLRLRPSPGVSPTATLASQEVAAAHRPAQPRGPDSPRAEPVSVALGLALAGLLATGVAFLFLRHRRA